MVSRCGWRLAQLHGEWDPSPCYALNFQVATNLQLSRLRRAMKVLHWVPTTRLSADPAGTVRVCVQGFFVVYWRPSE